MKIKYSIKPKEERLGLWNNLTGPIKITYNSGEFSIELLKQELIKLFYGK